MYFLLKMWAFVLGAFVCPAAASCKQIMNGMTRQLACQPCLFDSNSTIKQWLTQCHLPTADCPVFTSVRRRCHKLSPVYASVRENVCNISKNVKVMFFWISKKTLKTYV